MRNGRNDGFAGGNNIGIKRAIEDGCNFVALINNDTKIIDDSLDKCVKLLAESEDIAICGLVNYFYDSIEEVWQSGFRNDFFSVKQKPVFGVSLDHNYFEVDYVPGSSLVARASIFGEIGFLDEKYFAYYEENDFCMRAKYAGYKTVVVYDGKILHKVGRSSSGLLKHYLRTRNSMLFWSSHGNLYHVLVNFGRFFFRTLKLAVKYRSFSYLVVNYRGFQDFLCKNYGKGSMDLIIK